MKSNALFILCLLFLSSIFALEFKLKEADPSNIVQEFAELHKAINTPKETLNSIMGQVVVAAELASSFKAQFAPILQNCKNMISMMNQFIKKIQGDIISDKSAFHSATLKLAKTNKDKAKTDSDFKKAEAELERLNKQLDIDTKKHEQVQIEIGEKLLIIKRLRDIIKDELINASVPGAFVQIKVNEFKSVLAELKKKVDSMNDKLVFSPLVDALVSLVYDQNFSDQKILSKILNVLAKLEKSLQEFEKREVKEFGYITSLNKKQIQSQYKIISALHKMLSMAVQDEKFYEQLAQHSTNSIKLLNAHLAKKNRELKYLTKICDYQAGINKKYNSDTASMVGTAKRMQVHAFDSSK